MRQVLLCSNECMYILHLLSACCSKLGFCVEKAFVVQCLIVAVFGMNGIVPLIICFKNGLFRP